MMKLILKIIIFLSINCVFSYRLNVPKVLLPYKTKIPVNFTLEVTDPEGGCFVWRSSRPEIATVTLLTGEDSPQQSCSDKAVVSAISKHKQPHTAIVFAEDKLTGLRLRCDVMVDVIDSIEIITTTRKLFLEDAPEEFVVRAQNSQKDTFSELGGLAFDWSIIEKNAVSKSHHTLKIIPFSESKYETPSAIEQLEAMSLQGHMILIEGINTGWAELTMKLSDDEYKDIKEHRIDLVVIANLILNPAYDVYVPVEAIIHYKVELIKQGRVDEVFMPSNQYYLELDKNIAILDSQTSNVTAKKIGQTQLSLLDRNMETQKTFQPPAAFIYVSSPASLTFVVRPGGVWVLETERIYEIELKLFDDDGREMYISQNMIFDITLPKEHLKLIEKSMNGSYVIVETLKKGRTQLKAVFESILKETGEAVSIMPKVTGEQTVEIYDKIKIKPNMVVFAWDAITRARYQYQMKALGGSGRFLWTSADKHVAVISEQNGQLSTVEVGTTTVTARDVKNKLHKADATVIVTPPTRIEFAESRVEAEIGTKLELVLAVFGRKPDNAKEEVKFVDCRQLQFSIVVKDWTVFQYEKDIALSLPSNGCAALSLSALKIGDTKVLVEYRRGKIDLQTSITVSVYDPLKITEPENDLLLALGSSYEIKFAAGPRPWVLDGSNYFAKLEKPTGSKEDLLFVKSSQKNGQRTFVLTCKNAEGSIEMNLNVGNGKTATNPIPALVQTKLRICCSVPKRLSIVPYLPDLGKNFPPCPVHQKSSQLYPLYFGKEAQIQVIAKGICPGSKSSELGDFDNFMSLRFHWQSSQPEWLTIKNQLKVKDENKFYETVVPHGKEGLVTVSVSSKAYIDPICAVSKTSGCERKITDVLTSNAELKLTDYAAISPKSVAVFNHPKNQAQLEIKHGSGHFFITNDVTIRDFGVVGLQGEKITFSPKRSGQSLLEVYDLCLGPVDKPVKADIYISHIDRIEVSGPDLVEINTEIQLIIRVFDQRNQAFNCDVFHLMQLKTILDSVGILTATVDETKTQGTEMVLQVRGVKVATERLSITGLAATGRKVTSTPHTIQVFAPLSLRPKIVTLVPEAVFQLEAIGGPQPSPGLEFSLNNTSIAKVTEIGLIEAQKLGYAKITGRIITSQRSSSISNDIVSEDFVYLRVVSLSGVKIHVPVTQIYAGTTIPVFAIGLAQNETPFSFGGDKFPIKFQWFIDNGDVAVLNSVFDKANLVEPLSNQFAIRLLAKRPGHVTLRLRAMPHVYARNHFSLNQADFKDSIRITVVEPLLMKKPDVGGGANLLMSPNTEVKLLTNKPDTTYTIVDWQSTNERLVDVDSSTGLLRSGALTGKTSLIVNAQSTNTMGTRNESLTLLIEVQPVAYIMWNGNTIIKTVESLDKLPIGYSMDMRVSFHDQMGRTFHATNTDLNYRSHRFDLSDSIPSENNRSLTMQLKHSGEIVLKIWDSNHPKVMDFVRFTVGDIISPSNGHFVVGDVICLTSPLHTHFSVKWQSDKPNLLDVVHPQGLAIVKQPGHVIVSLIGPQSAATRTTITVTKPNLMRISVQPDVTSKFITNGDGFYSFPVILSSLPNQTTNLHGCFDNLSKYETQLNAMHPPFSCTLDWDKTRRSYHCVVKPLPVESNERFSKFASNLVVSARYGSQHDQERYLYESVSIPFYPQFYVVQREIQLNNVHTTQTQLTIAVSPLLIPSLKLTTSHSNMLTVSKSEPDSEDHSRLQYVIGLNTKSTSLWQDSALNDVTVTITSSLSGQQVTLPIRVKVYGEAPKAAFLAASSTGFWGFMEVFLEYYGSALLVFLSIIATLVCLYIGYRVFVPRTMVIQGGQGVFASDTSPSQSYIQWRTYGSPLQNTAAPSTGSGGKSVPYLWSMDRAQTPPGGSPQFGQTPTFNRSR